MAALSAGLSAAEKKAWLRLARTAQVGPQTFFRLLEQYGTASAALAALPELARRGGRSAALRVPSESSIEQEIEKTAALGGRIIAFAESDYPDALRSLEDAPPVLTVLGSAPIWHRPCVALVGSRNASLNGKKIVAQLAADLGAQGYVVVSGLARGIDGAAHQAALTNGTIAVVAGGADVIYPPEHTELHHNIKSMGSIMAEMPLGTETVAQLFPRRNRIISGLCLGVVVIEAQLGSGSLITARMAAEQGREVFAVPGSPLDPRCQGSNQLLKEGAHLVETVSDIISQLQRQTLLHEKAKRPYTAPPARPTSDSDLTQARAQILEMLSPTPITLDELLRACHLSPPIVHTLLLELELAERLERHPGQKIALRV